MGNEHDAQRDQDAVDAALRAVDWEKTRLALTRWCWLATGKRSWEDAEDTAQEAIAQLLDPTYAQWNPTKTTVLRHLTNVARGILANARRTRGRNEKITADDELELLAPDVDDGEAAAAERALAKQIVERVRASAADDEDASAALSLYADGVESLDDHATAMNRPKHEARNARRRLQTHAERARRALLGDES